MNGQVEGNASDWQPLLREVPQGSSLGLLLFLTQVTYFDYNVTSNILKFADDTKLFKTVVSYDNTENWQGDIDKLVKWSEKWQMIFNLSEFRS